MTPKPNISQLFKSAGNISFLGLRDVAVAQLSRLRQTYRDKLYEDLERGKGILDDDEHLNQYLWSFGKMHNEKLLEAFQYVPDKSFFTNDDFELYDWGCGQGTATLCFLDFLKRNNIAARIKRITLIDPSEAAVSRAYSIIKCYDIAQNIEIRKVCKGFDDLSSDDITDLYHNKFHIFSNILDVAAFDLANFTQLFQLTMKKHNLFICVGPYYYNNHRVDDFVSAIAPDSLDVTFNKDKHQWKNDWSFVLRIFSKTFTDVEKSETINQRIAEARKHKQLYAGYILDEVSDALKSSMYSEKAELLLNTLSRFDIRSNTPMNLPDTVDSKWAVLNNILTRGLPTLAPIMLQEIFSKHFGLSKRNKGSGTIHFDSAKELNLENLFDALHVIDPRFDIDFYNGDMLESDFEHNFIRSDLWDNGGKYLVQLFEPQRQLSSIVSIPDKQFIKDQRVDFALQLPSTETNDNPVGFIVEIDGSAYHSNIFNRINDERRNRIATQNNFDTYRLSETSHSDFIKNWEDDNSCVEYLSRLKNNFDKSISGEWADYLQYVLSPLAIARVERTIIEAIISGALKLDATCWNIAIIERDVPCAAIALKNLIESYKHLCCLDGTEFTVPEIKLHIQSTKEFLNSPLHIGNNVALTLPLKNFDICIDIAMLLRDHIDAMPIVADADTFYIVRTSHYKKQERTIITSENINYLPLVHKDDRGEYIEDETPKEHLTYFLNNIFRKESFRTGQLPIISRALTNNTTIGLLPTGGGKSLTYQIASMLQPGVTLVVDPLISLMVDQYSNLNAIRIDACACVNSTMEAVDKNRSLVLLQNGGLIFMLLSPERFMMQNFRENLQAMSRRNNVYFAYGVIDEVHCVSEWGHDFRPSYLHLGRNMINYMLTKSGKSIPIMGLTATASFDVLADVERELTLGGNLALDSDAIVRPENDTRSELTYRIVQVKANFDELKSKYIPYVLDIVNDRPLKNKVAEAKKHRLQSLLSEVPSHIDELNNSNSTCAVPDFSLSQFFSPDENELYNAGGIVFCPHAKGIFGVNDSVTQTNTTSGIASNLLESRSDILKLGTFVGGNKPTGDMALFKANKLNIMVATKAFGMGIDKPNVRYTVNFTHPSSIESFVQEAGRGGRDKKNAISYLLYEPTEYICLSLDKIQDITVHLGYTQYPQWLWNFRDKYVLEEDFIDFLSYNGCDTDTAKVVFEFCKHTNFFENVDKDIELWFHNNSFRGVFKEKVILLEMTDRILNVRPSRLLPIQNQLREDLGNDDIVLRLKPPKNNYGASLVIASEENSSNQYGFVFLDSLRASYNYCNFDYSTCSRITNATIELLRKLNDRSYEWLSKPIDNFTIEEDGIYTALDHCGNETYTYVNVSWENSIKQDEEEFERTIREAIQTIATSQQWNLPVEDGRNKLDFKKISTFDELLAKLARLSEDVRWQTYHRRKDIYKTLSKAFSRKRDKDDTDKAIYRMCCVGLVDDVLIDYNLQTYQLKVRNRTDEEYLDCMFNFFRKYFSEEQALQRVAEIRQHDGRRVLDKCLGYLAEFVYENLEAKRYRSIDDMRNACVDGNSRGDDWLKEFIHLYFNSKYAREDYKIGQKDYSLKKDTDKNREDFGVVQKYIEAIAIDNSGSEVDNVKHLYGATLLVLRAHPENAALNILRTFCIAFLGTGGNDSLQYDAIKGYVDGFYRLHEVLSIKLSDLSALVDDFNSILLKYVHGDDDYIKNEIITSGKDLILMNIHNHWVENFARKYSKN